ncbi:Exoglucanase-6A [Drechslerella dactyloides]|uniref:Glucanase n=1 Tax=Drechslerella dactyloides TaxID=74499 RepID=A0AAD6J4F3_DREDA|nr:Exoglucanase-6A [Drechslerella dactyloides]
MKYSLAFSALALVSGAAAQQTMWGQCGGIGWTGPSNCVAGAACSTLNPYYAQCLSGGGGGVTTSRTTTTTSRVTTTTGRTTTTTTRTTTPSSTRTSTTSTRTSTTSSRTTPPPTTTTTRTTTGGGGNPGNPITLSGNPFAGRKQYANAYYSSEVYSLAVPSLVAAGKASLTAAAKAVATVPSFVWFDNIAKVPTLDGYLADIRAKRAGGQDLIGIFVVYDLPDRDCAALASNGELSIANNGVNIYKTQYIDPLVTIFKKYPDVPVALVIEPDSLANMITNKESKPKCANAQTAYEDCVNYALTHLNLPNIAQYIDAGHAGWLGWPDNLTKSGPYFANVYKRAGNPASFRGLATNVANYNAWSISQCPPYASQLPDTCDEKRYINKLAPLLKNNGWPDPHFIVDQGRSGKQPTGQQEWGDWCNAIGTGFGTRPDSPTSDPLLDAFVWIKPGGECDGTSDTTAVRYDGFCGKTAALKPAPEAGQWFQAYFEQLLVNANPPFP